MPGEPRDVPFDPTKVDLVGASAEGVLQLFIVQDQPWSGSDAQLTSLQEKVQTYVSYALDGQLERDYPEVVGKPWQIVIHSQVGQPDERTQYVLTALNARLGTYGGWVCCTNW
jgi:hypothetical protein